jgi:hypothetical protein
MEIKIDTQKDSSDDIRRAIEFLQKFVDGASAGSGQQKEFSLDSNVSQMGSIFGDDPSSGSGSSPEAKSEGKKKIFDDEVRIIPY